MLQVLRPWGGRCDGRRIDVDGIGWLGLQTIVNLGAVSGLLPITGVPLPLLSYGGSNLVVTLAAIGILWSVARRTAPADRATSIARSRPGS